MEDHVLFTLMQPFFSVESYSHTPFNDNSKNGAVMSLVFSQH